VNPELAPSFSTQKILFWVPGAGGNVFAFRYLARALLEKGIVLRTLALDKGTPSNYTIPTIARSFASQMLTLQPEGGFSIGGWCFGGAVALEIASQLELAGSSVIMLALLDTTLVGSATSNSPKTEMSFARLPYFISELTWRLFKSFRRWMVRLCAKLSVPVSTTMAEQIHFDKDMTAFRLFDPPKYGGLVSLLWSTQEASSAVKHPRETYKQYNITSRDLEGSHLSLLRPPRVEQLASILYTLTNASKS
jgi:pyochelin synthetase